MASKKQKEKKASRYASAKTRVDTHGSGFEPTSFTPPEGVSVFQFKKPGNYRLDILPYKVKKGKDQAGGNPYAEKGILHYERTYFTHNSIGADNKKYACLRKTFGKKCPICDHQAKLRRNPNADLDMIKELNPRERQLFVVKDLNDPDKGFQIYETAFYKSFGEKLDNKVKSDPDNEDGYQNFFHLEDGLTLKITVVQTSFNGITFNAPENIEFKPRKDQYDNSVIDDVPCLDDVIKELSYKELKDVFEQGGDEDTDKDDDEDKDDEDADEDEDEDDDEEEEEEEEEEKPKKKGKKVTAKSLGIEKGSKIIHAEHGECKVLKISPDGLTLKLKDEDGEIQWPVDSNECEVMEADDEDEDSDEEEEKPKKKVKKSKPSKDDDDADEDEDDDEEEEEEKPKKKGKPSKKKKSVDEDEDEEDDDDEEDGWGDEDDD